MPEMILSPLVFRYAHLFSQLTYEQMLNLNEEQLENQGVTKGSQLRDYEMSEGFVLVRC